VATTSLAFRLLFREVNICLWRITDSTLTNNQTLSDRRQLNEYTRWKYRFKMMIRKNRYHRRYLRCRMNEIRIWEVRRIDMAIVSFEIALIESLHGKARLRQLTKIWHSLGLTYLALSHLRRMCCEGVDFFDGRRQIRREMQGNGTNESQMRISADKMCENLSSELHSREYYGVQSVVRTVLWSPLSRFSRCLNPTA